MQNSSPVNDVSVGSIMTDLGGNCAVDMQPKWFQGIVGFFLIPPKNCSPSPMGMPTGFAFGSTRSMGFGSFVSGGVSSGSFHEVDVRGSSRAQIFGPPISEIRF